MGKEMSMAVRWLAVVSAVVGCSVADTKLDPDNHKTIQQLIQEKGYPCEEHFIVTPDGYQLGTFRIAYGRSENASALRLGKPAVILQHGLLDSAYTWTVNSPDESLAYILADQGYDVWMPNNRGNDFSKKNLFVRTKSDEFWNLTFDEMARYDVPSVIDYILDYTGNSQIAYVGHSEGTTQMFAAPYFDTDNQLPKKVALFLALAPVAYVHHCKSPLLDVLADLRLDVVFEKLGVRQFLPGYALHSLVPRFCSNLDSDCDFYLELICGPSTNINETRIPMYLSVYPADTSAKNIAHWAQEIRREKFEMFDYGSAAKNEAVYGPGMTEPPQYNLTELSIPTVMYSGTNDFLADPTDVAKLQSELNLKYLVDHIIIDGYAHGDFVWAYNANTKLYPDMIGRLETYLGSGVTLVK